MNARWKQWIVAGLVLCLASLSASAGVIWTDDFQSYAYNQTGASGDEMNAAGWSISGPSGQGAGWTTNYGNIGDTVPPQFFLEPSYTTDILSRSFGEMGAYETLKVSFDVFSPQNAAWGGFRVMLADSQTSNKYSFRCESTEGFGDPASGFFMEGNQAGLGGKTLPTTANDQQRLELVYNKSGAGYSWPTMFAYLDGVTVFEWYNMPAFDVDALQFQSIDGQQWIIDNIAVEMVPEPATLGLLGIGGLALLRRRRR